MSASFNVLSEGWIPVIDLENKRKKLGILDTLKNAHRLKAISDASAMVEYSLYRFLSVFLMDALRPKDKETLEDLLEEGSFDPESIDDYITLCENEGVRFDLFDKERPFLQTPYSAVWDKSIKPAAELDYTLPRGNNHTHYDHRNGESCALQYDAAARLLLPAQWFCTAGAQGYPSNVSASPPYYTVVRGRNLFETLVYSLSVTNRINIPFDDPPVLWRNTEPVEPKKEVTKTSWLFGMLFPARRIVLVPRDGMVSEVYLCQGMNYTSKETWDDPFVTYRYSKEGRAPWRPNQEKAVWRNLNDLVDVKGKKAPYMLRQYFELDKEAENASVSLYGVQTNQGSYLGMLHFDLDIPVRLAQDEDHIRCLEHCIKAVENLAGALRRSFAGIPEIPAGIVSQAVQEYYDLCEQKFWIFIRNSLAAENADLLDAYQAWCDYVIRTVKAVRERTTSNLRLNGRALAEAAKKEKEIAITVKKLREANVDGE